MSYIHFSPLYISYICATYVPTRSLTCSSNNNRRKMFIKSTCAQYDLVDDNKFIKCSTKCLSEQIENFFCMLRSIFLSKNLDLTLGP